MQDVYDYLNNSPCPGIMDPVRLLNLHHLLTRVLLQGVPGDVVELGVFTGSSAILLQKTLAAVCPDRNLHLYDSFEGLTDFSRVDYLDHEVVDRSGRKIGPGESYRPLHAYKSSPDELRRNFTRYNTRIPSIHLGSFADTIPGALPDEICFAHLDSDLYLPLKLSLAGVFPRLSRGAIVVVDDYDPSGGIFPGCKAAVEEFFRSIDRDFATFDLSCHVLHARQCVYIHTGCSANE